MILYYNREIIIMKLINEIIQAPETRQNNSTLNINYAIPQIIIKSIIKVINLFIIIIWSIN